jgi:hypothetical protein
MYVRWQPCRTAFRVRRYRGTPAAGYAILVESARIDGKPRQRHIAYLGTVHSKPDVNYRAWWWHHMTAKLDRLGNVIPPDQRPRIDAALAKRVPLVTAAEVTAFDLAYQKEMREDGLSEGSRGCYLNWPEGTEGVPPRPQFEKREPWANVIAALGGE